MSSPVATYNYGETPEEVIRERLAAFDSERELAFAEGLDTPEGKDWLYAVRQIHAYRDNSDDLLTVLDALAMAAERYDQLFTSVGGDESDGEDAHHWRTLRNNARNLRIAILAALGIEEA